MEKEIKRLVEMLEIANIPFELTDDIMENSDNQIWYPNYKEHICDVICHEFSYGGKDGLLEIMGLSENEYDDVEGWLTAEEVFKKIHTDYYKENI
jgi:hypothetical protein